MSSFLHFTLGPVQGFVAQARRTRDFWAGSFLLSWLTARAMKAVEDGGGTVVMPSVEEDPLLARVQAASGRGPSVGSLPNNFVAEIPDGWDGNIAVEAVRAAWKELADAVWRHDKLEAAGVSRTLWEAQIGGFWEMAWVISDHDDGAVLARRKNWRSHLPPESLGDKCTMMGEWQELSGAIRPNPTRQKRFWHALKQQAGISDIELREHERLCAIAYIKRRFVHAWQELPRHQGWVLPTSVPSTSYMAAVHWLAALIAAAPDPEPVERLCKLSDSGERKTRIRAISHALGTNPADHLQRLADIDGRALFDSEQEEDAKIVAAKREVLRTVPDFHAPLSPFYAILMMDGDSLGETKRALAKAGKRATALSDALARFTRNAPEIVREHNGFLIYAGGDDLLAILPLEDAMDCALACRRAYQSAFGAQQATISAAIEYAHMKLPLTMILQDAHRLLDGVAKEATGRDAIACRVWKPGGVQQTWAMPWDAAIKEERISLAQLANRLGEDEAGQPGYANKLLYHLRATLEMVKGGAQIGADALRDMLIADYVGSGLLDGVENKQKKARKLIAPLLEQCRVFSNGQDTGRHDASGALLLRFLAQKGVER